MKNETSERDYDKNPIVIEDRMPEIGFWFFMSFAIIPLCVVLFIMQQTGIKIDWTHVLISASIIYIPGFFSLAVNMPKDKKIKFYENKIVREWDEKLLELNFNEELDFQIGYIDFYNKRQEANDFVKLLLPIYYPIVAFIQHPYLLIIKTIYKSINKFNNKKKFDTLYIFNKTEMIAVFIESDLIEKDLKKYLSLKSIDITLLETFYTTSYVFDGMNNFINK